MSRENIPLWTDSSFSKIGKNKYSYGWCGIFDIEGTAFVFYGYYVGNKVKTSAEAEMMSIVNSFKLLDLNVQSFEISKNDKKLNITAINDLKSMNNLINKTSHWKNIQKNFSVDIKWKKRRSCKELIIVDNIAKKMLKESRYRNQAINVFIARATESVNTISLDFLFSKKEKNESWFKQVELSISLLELLLFFGLVKLSLACWILFYFGR